MISQRQRNEGGKERVVNAEVSDLACVGGVEDRMGGGASTGQQCGGGGGGVFLILERTRCLFFHPYVLKAKYVKCSH